MEITKIQIKQHNHGNPIDKALLEYLPTQSRRQIRRLLDKGLISINNKRVWLASFKVAANDWVQVRIPSQSQVVIPTITQQDFISISDDFIVLNKPPLVAVNPTKSHKDLCVEKQLATHFSHLFPQGAYLCHRLDKETSGALLLATNKKACEQGIDCFRTKAVEKTYLALCWGKVPAGHWNVQNYLSPLSGTQTKVNSVQSGGKKAITHFSVLASHHNVHLVKCTPLTGRTHQIRVHLSQSGVPIVGDKKYSSVTSVPKILADIATHHHLLHAYHLKIASIGEFTAPLPPLWRKALKITHLDQCKLIS